jgi:hypothetical protein
MPHVTAWCCMDLGDQCRLDAEWWWWCGEVVRYLAWRQYAWRVCLPTLRHITSWFHFPLRSLSRQDDSNSRPHGSSRCYKCGALRRRIHTTGISLLVSVIGLVWFWLLLYAHRHRSISRAAGHLILTPANQLMVTGLKIWSLSNPGFEQGTFDHWPTSLPSALTGPTSSRCCMCSEEAEKRTH